MPGTIIIRHTRAEGTLIEGSRKGDGVWPILKDLRHNWRYFPSLAQIGIGQSRDRPAHPWKIQQAAQALRAAGFEVTVEIDDTTPGRPFAEAEADRYGRAEDRASYHAGHADRAGRASEAAYAAEHAILDVIPPGQPILSGHHSERRHRRDLARADARRQRGRDEADRAAYHTGRAETAGRFQARRESVPTTLRRIGKLEAEQRQLERRLNGTGLAIHGENTPAAGDYRVRLLARQDGIADELAYWRKHIADAQAAGARLWSRADFTKGDFVQFLGKWFEVLRVNGKSVTIPAMISDGIVVTRRNTRLSWTDTVPYDQVTGRKSRGEITAMLAGPAGGAS
jgi:hypothetical protein